MKKHRRERKTSARIDQSTRGCRCRNSWHRRRRDVWRAFDFRCRQPARRTPRRLRNNDPNMEGTTVAGGASRAARLQYLSAPEPCGRQPRIRHDVNDPLLLAPQEKLTSNLLRVLVFLLMLQQSAGWTPQRRKIGGKTIDMQV